jgi:CRP-like cAMP-binding protein
MARTEASSVAALEQVPLLAELTKRDRQKLAQTMKEHTYAPGKQVVVQGRGGLGFFIIVDGTAAVTVGDRVVRALGPGDYFGEMALLSGEERTATVTADTELRCLGVTAWNFKRFVTDNPSVAWALLQTLAERLREASFAIYRAGSEYAARRGIIIADTKFEFGIDRDGTVRLIDELLTPDSSRFWPAEHYRPGQGQPSFDKQPLRDYLASLRAAGEWNGEAPPPVLPPEVVDATSRRYLDAFRILTGRELDEDL